VFNLIVICSLSTERYMYRCTIFEHGSLSKYLDPLWIFNAAVDFGCVQEDAISAIAIILSLFYI